MPRSLLLRRLRQIPSLSSSSSLLLLSLFSGKATTSRRRRRRRREYYFLAVKVLAAEQQPHFSFSPFCYVSSRNEYFSLSFLKLSLFYEMTSSSKHFRESHKANSTSVSHKNKATSSADDGCASIGMEGAFYRVFFSSYNFANVLGARNSVGGD